MVDIIVLDDRARKSYTEKRIENLEKANKLAFEEITIVGRRWKTAPTLLKESYSAELYEIQADIRKRTTKIVKLEEELKELEEKSTSKPSQP